MWLSKKLVSLQRVSLLNKKNMKRILCLLMLISTACLFNSCSKDDDKDVVEVIKYVEKDQQTNNQVEDTRYYVKYEVTYKTRWLNDIVNVTIATESGEKKHQIDNGSSTGSWEATYGPLKKGFTTYLKFLNQSTYNLNQCHARIYVSREKEPFVIKAEGSGVNSLNLSYQIDF